MKPKLIHVLLTLLLIAGALACGCTSSTSSPEESATPVSTDVSMNTQASVLGDTLTIDGEITVPDGALLTYQILYSNEDWTKTVLIEPRDQGPIEVTDNKFEKEIDISEIPDGEEFSVWVAFDAISQTSFTQPQEIKDLYGELGEKITGSQAVKSGYGYRVEVETNVRK